MAKITLPTNYRDDILNTSAEGKRKYVMSYNQDGTVSFEDVTPYEQVGSDFGAGDINTTNEAVNESFDKNKLVKDLDTINALTEEGFAPDALAVKQLNESLNESLVASDNLKFKFATDGEGNYGYLGADDSFIPFSSANVEFIPLGESTGKTYTFTEKYSNVIVCMCRSSSISVKRNNNAISPTQSVTYSTLRLELFELGTVSVDETLSFGGGLACLICL